MVNTFFVFPEFDLSFADGPSACFAGVRPEDVPLKKGGAGLAGGDFIGDIDGGTAAVVVLNGFP